MRARTRRLKSASLVRAAPCPAAPPPQQPPRPAAERRRHCAPRVRLPLPPGGGGLRPPHGGSARSAAVRGMISDERRDRERGDTFLAPHEPHALAGCGL